MYYKKIVLLSIIIVIALGISPAQEQKGLIPIDRIIAVVNDTIITKSDIDKSKLLYPYFLDINESDKVFDKRVLNDLFDYRIISLEYGEEYTLNEEDYERVQIPIINKMGSMRNLLEIIKKFNMTWDNFKEFIKEKVIYEKVIIERFQMAIPITYAEIENFYQQNYLLVQRRMNLEIKPLLEMMSLIENYLKKERTKDRLSGWLNDIRASYKIENKLNDQGFK